MSSPTPANETERLAALHALDIIDSGPETAYDEIAELAAQLCGCPAAYISFIDDDRRWHKSEQARFMRDACKIAKIKPDVGFHQLRHTWASHAVMNGTPLLVVAANLGHADTRMVERHYAHLTSTFVDEAIRAGAPRFGAVAASNVMPLARRKGS